MKKDTPFAAIGYEEYFRPAIPATTEGEIFVPFWGCFALRRINLRCSNPPPTYHHGTFENHSFNTATIVVPFGSVDNYRNDKTFSSFRYHAEHIPTFPKRQP